jgi:GAF domain-containing protein
VAELETEHGLARQVEKLEEQRSAVADVLRAVARSEGLQPVLDEILASATRLCEAENGRMWLLEGDLLHAVANEGTEEGFEYDKERPHALDESSAAGRAAHTRQVVHIADTEADPGYSYAGPRPYRTNLSVPIQLENELIGVIGLTRSEPGAFTDEQVALVETFADQAAIAIANARLIDKVEKQLEEQQAVGNTLRAVAEGGGLQPVLEAIVEAAKRLCRGEHGQLYLVDGDYLRIFSHSSDMETSFDFARDHPHARDRTTVVGRVSLSGEVEQIPDVLADPEYEYEGQKFVGYRALLGVPIAREGELIGAIAVGRDEPGLFADDLVELVKTFADEAAVAIANARLIDAVRRQLEQQRAIADVLGVVARAEGLEAVFNAVVETAARLCSADYGQICLADGDVFRLAGSHGASPEVVAYEQAHPSPRDRATVVGRVGVTGDVVHIPDVLADPEYSWGNDASYRAMLGVPIFVEDELIGVINVVRDEPLAFSNEQIELVKTFADQAAIAIANARLLDAVERQLEQQRAVGDVLRAIALSEGLESVFEAVVAAATRLCHGDFGALYLRDGEVFRLSTRHEWDPGLDEFEREHPHVIDRTSVIGRVALTRDVVHIPDVAQDPEYEWGGRDVAEYHAVLGAPIIVEGDLIGALDVTRCEPGPFAPEEVRLIRTFADQAAIAIANARLIEAVERQLEHQRAISDVLGVVARSEGLDSVFAAVVEAATRLCEGEYGGLYILEDDLFHARSHFGMAKQYEYEQEHPHAPDRRTLVGRVGLTKDVVHIPDLAEDPEYDWPLLLNHHAGLAVPILVEDELFGAIAVTRQPEPFTSKQVDLVKTFADQAAIAIANARLLGAVERQRSELSRFISPQVAELISSDDGEKMLAGHRAYVTSLFCDLRGFTSFTESAAHEELFGGMQE